jgi:hypothetical protein
VAVIETRDVTPGEESLTHIRRMVARYELEGADPMLLGAYSVGRPETQVTTWGEFNWGQAAWADSTDGEYVALADPALKQSGRDVHRWYLTVRARFIRGRLTSANASSRDVIRSVEFSVRPSGKDR